MAQPPLSIDVFNYGRMNVQKITNKNREALFVEVNQQELNRNIFLPIRNLFKYENHFFPKRFAILGDFKTGKTELGKYILHKINKHYTNCINITINAQRLQFTGLDEINDWIYGEWYTSLSQVSNPEFQEIYYRRSHDFEKRHHGPPAKFIDKIYLICEIYREFLRENPDAKFVVGFDQANLIENEKDFTPFFQFWRNFQGYWEMDTYFSELPLFIFVIGHKNWIDFAHLQNSVGRGVFDKWIKYIYWSNIDIEQMYKKRLIYAIEHEVPEEIQQKVLDYFLCSGIVDYFGRKLSNSSTQEYLDQFFGKYLTDFLTDFEANIKKYKNFLDYCKRKTTQKKSDDKYFYELERVFMGTPALDYTPVFQFLSENQERKWFEDLFSLIEIVYDKKSIKFGSKDFQKHQNLNYDFIYNTFTNSPFDGDFSPKYTPALLTNHKDDLILNETFKSCLEAIEGRDRRGPIHMLKRFVKSKRVNRVQFDESKNGAEMENLLNKIKINASAMLEIVNRWGINSVVGVVQSNQPINQTYLTRFYKYKENSIEFIDLYKKKSTNWPYFDKLGRNLVESIVEKSFPEDAIISKHLDFEHLRNLRTRAFQPTISNIELTQVVAEIIECFLTKMQEFDTRKDELKIPQMIEKPKIVRNQVLLVVDGPNSLGQDYKDRINLKTLIKYAQHLNNNADLCYFYKLGEKHIKPDKISAMGFSLTPHHKDIDHKIKEKIRRSLNSKSPPTLIIICTKDGDFADFIKNIRNTYQVNFILAVSSKQGLAHSLEMIFEEEDIKFFPKKLPPQKYPPKQSIVSIADVNPVDYIKAIAENDIYSYDDLQPGMILKGIVTRVERYGAFIDIGLDRTGLVHISEISNRYVENVANYLPVGHSTQFVVLNVDIEKRKFTLSLKGVKEYV